MSVGSDAAAKTFLEVTVKKIALLCALVMLVGSASPFWRPVLAQQAGAAEAKNGTNLALVAKVSTSFVSGHENLAAIADGFDPRDSGDKSHTAYGNWPQRGTQWVQYEWPEAISTSKMEVYWFSDGGGVQLPKACRLKTWKDGAFVTVENAGNVGVAGNKFNVATFPELSTTKLRLEFDAGPASTGILEWRVYDSGKSPNFAPAVTAGVDRVVMLSGKTFLSGTVKDDGKPQPTPTVSWSKAAGPGEVTFADPKAAVTTATFSAPGTYTLKLAANDGALTGAETLQVIVENPPPAKHLEPIHTLKYKINSPLWNSRVKNLIVNWIPHCYKMISTPTRQEVGIQNFVEAGNKIAGRPYKNHVGPVFANTWVYNTIESMCIALMVDPQGDQDIIAAQNKMREQLEDAIPKILSAQEPDGYLHTDYTLNNRPRWSNKFDHEGYQAGYFMEAAMAHYLMTGGTDKRMYNAAKKLADCWVANIGPAPKKYWYDGHQELEQALVRLARFVEAEEGAGKGQQYIALAKFLLDSRKNGDEYDQSHLPVVQQYEAVGHSVRAAYCYSGMANVAMQTGDIDYLSAVKSIWHNIVATKYYITGGVGSGETSEGFGKNYSLPNNAYCESCANCGELFFEHALNMTYHDAKYADLYENTIYNAILGDVDFEAKNYTYTNALDSSGKRYPWHGCPCCVGNIPRTLLMMPTWMYVTGENELYVNLFVGSTVKVGKVAGTDIEMIQETDYPWSGKVAITVNPAAAKEFALNVRVPNRQPSILYTSTPEVDGLVSLAVNGEKVTPKIENGYAVLTRTWKAGDKVTLEMPMKVQRVKADERVAADRGRVALRYGPMVFNLEEADQKIDGVLAKDAELKAEFDPKLLGGVMTIQGKFADGTPFKAIPNWARLNRGGRSTVWIKDQ